MGNWLSHSAIPFVGAFESTYQPVHDRDVMETTQHTQRWREDLMLLHSCNVRQLRYPLRWHRIEPEPGRFDWSRSDEVLGFMRDIGVEPIIDLLHHTSYPLWLGDLGSPGFEPAFLRFVEAVGKRYPWLPAYTVCNEPFTTLLLCGQLAVWPPHGRGLPDFVRLATNVMPAVNRASLALKDMLDNPKHVHAEVCERHTWSSSAGEEFAYMTNDRRFLMTDLLVGHEVDPGRPFVQDLLAAGGEDLLMVEPGTVDVLGLDYYVHNQWEWSAEGKGTTVPLSPMPLSELIIEYWDRYKLPCILGETNIRGYASDRASWLKYTLEECERAQGRGVALQGYCWFPFIDSADWGSLLANSVGEIDPVGVYWLDDQMDRRPSSMSVSYAMAAGGIPAAELPAYRFRRPVSDWLTGWTPQLSTWQWRDPPRDEVCSSKHDPDDRVELRAASVT